jgi:hypothetical protein
MSAQVNNSLKSAPIVEQADLLAQSKNSASNPPNAPPQEKIQPTIRPAEQRRTPPDRGVIPLAAKDRIGPKIWALYGRVDTPVLLKDDRYIEASFNGFYRDQNGWAFLLVPYVSEDDPNRAEIADAAYRRAVALGIIERPEVFLTCLYHYQLPEYRILAIHLDEPDDVIEEDKCLVIVDYECARLADQLTAACISVDANRKIKPVSVLNADGLSNNLIFALNTLFIHHNYDEASLNALIAC